MDNLVAAMKTGNPQFAELILSEECYLIIGIAMKVHAKLGKGFNELVYQDAMEAELKRRGIRYEREKKLSVFYEGEILTRKFIVDFLVFDSIILEIKSTTKIYLD